MACRSLSTLFIVCSFISTSLACGPKLEEKQEEKNTEDPLVEVAPDVDWRRGANIAWIDYGSDFGGNPWSNGLGLKTSSEAEKLDMLIAELDAQGVTWLRWFVLSDLRSGVIFTEDGTPQSLDPLVLENIQFLLDRLPEHMHLMPVILDFHFCSDDKVEGGVQIGGRCSLIRNREHRAAFAEHIVATLLTHFQDEPKIAAWDIINEPDWLTSTFFADITSDELDAFLKDMVRTVHQYATQPVTIGMASEDALNFLEDMDVDILQFHWYPAAIFGNDTPEFADYSDYQKPVILGEYPGNLNASHMHIWQHIDDSKIDGAAYWRAHFNDNDDDQWSGIPEFDM